MLMRIRHTNGVAVEGLILAADRNRMRITIPLQRDTAELHCVDGSWYTERLEAVEIESILQVPGIDASDFCAAAYPLTATAGRKVDH
jgi:hypothetical protein